MLDPDFRITTPRLHLSYLDPSNDAHMAFLAEVQNSPENIAVAALAGIKPPEKPFTIADMRAGLVARTERLEKTGSGRYIISLRSGDDDGGGAQAEHEFVGYVSMQLKRYPDIECPRIPDIGFVLLAKYYGKGYATEACNALMQHFRETKGYERFAGFTHPKNVNSQKLFRRLGFEDRGTMNVAGVVGSGAAERIAVWVKGVDSGTDLGELGIGSKKVDASDIGHLEAGKDSTN